MPHIDNQALHAGTQGRKDTQSWMAAQQRWKNAYNKVRGQSTPLFNGDDTPPGKVEEEARLAVATELLDHIRRFEPSITQTLRNIATELGAELYGLQHRLKTAKSLADKLTASRPDEIKDALRYTVGFRYGEKGEAISIEHQQEFIEKVTYTFYTLSRRGIKAVRIKNTFHDRLGYRGINANFLLPDRSSQFEIQLHTAQSFRLKSAEHGLYEEARAIERGIESGAYAKNDESVRTNLLKLQEAQRNVYKQIATPLGIHEWVRSIGAENLNFAWEGMDFETFRNKRKLSPAEYRFFTERVKTNLRKLQAIGA